MTSTMSDLRQCSREFLTEFIELYKSFPCLWRVKSKEYSDRNKKNQAYDVLIQKYKEVDTAATRDTITKKINSLRSGHRKELAKVNKSILSGAEYDDVYKPSLWYFDLFSFLSDQDTKIEAWNTTDDDSANSQEPKGPKDDADQSDIEGEAMETPGSPGTSTSSRGRGSTSCYTFLSQSSYRKRKPPPCDPQKTEVMMLDENKFESLKTDDSFDIFGKHIANKLRTLNSQQNMFAQKLINDVLFEAEMESLTRSFKIVDYKDITYNSCVALDRLDRTEVTWCLQKKNHKL